MDIEKQIKKGA